MKKNTVMNVSCLVALALLASCQGSVMGKKEKKEKDRPVVVSSPPSSSSSSAPSTSSNSEQDNSGRRSDQGRESDSRQKNPRDSVFDPKNSTWIKEGREKRQDSSNVVCSEKSGLRFEWLVPTQAADWMAYIFSDLPPSVKSQLSKQRPVVRLQVRSVGVNDELEENYVVGLLSFSADGSFIRDFESSEVATVRNLRSIDKLTMILKDSHSFQKTFVLKIERRHVSRFDQNREERIKQSPWDGVLYSAYKGKLNPLARVSGQMELLDFEQLHSLMSR